MKYFIEMNAPLKNTLLFRIQTFSVVFETAAWFLLIFNNVKRIAHCLKNIIIQSN